jgi:hypothetical protein
MPSTSNRKRDHTVSTTTARSQQLGVYHHQPMWQVTLRREPKRYIIRNNSELPAQPNLSTTPRLLVIREARVCLLQRANSMTTTALDNLPVWKPRVTLRTPHYRRLITTARRKCLPRLRLLRLHCLLAWQTLTVSRALPQWTQWQFTIHGQNTSGSRPHKR